MHDLAYRGLREWFSPDTVIELARDLPTEEKISFFQDLLRGVRVQPEGMERGRRAYLEKVLESGLRDVFDGKDSPRGSGVSLWTRLQHHPDGTVQRLRRGWDRVQTVAQAAKTGVVTSGQVVQRASAALWKVCGLATSAFKSEKE